MECVEIMYTEICAKCRIYFKVRSTEGVKIMYTRSMESRIYFKARSMGCVEIIYTEGVELYLL